MNDLYIRIMNLCNQKGINASKLCADVGICKSTLSELKTKEHRGMTAANAQKIASYFGVTVGYLYGKQDPDFEVSYLQAANKLSELVQDTEFIELYEAYCKLSKKNQLIVKGFIDDLI